MERLLLLNKFFKYTFIILIYSIINLNIQEIAEDIWSNLYLIVRKKVLLK